MLESYVSVSFGPKRRNANEYTPTGVHEDAILARACGYSSSMVSQEADWKEREIVRWKGHICW